MAFLGRARKDDLKILAKELGMEVDSEWKIIDLKNNIMKSEHYEEEFIKELLVSIKEEREREERVREERLREERAEERLREERAEERLREERAEERERAFQLERLRIEQGTRNSENIEMGRSMKVELQKLVPKFNAKEDDISLFLTLFERQAKIVGLIKENWVSQLIGILPSDIANLIARESEEEAKDYDYIKKLLLKRFKLSPERFRQKFVKHQKATESTWKDFAYELQNYCHEWVNGLEITSYDQLLDLIVTDQLKRRVPSEIKTHFIDEWSDILSPTDLAMKLDAYEEVRGDIKKAYYRKEPEENTFRSRQNFALNAKATAKVKDEIKFGKGQRNEDFERRKKAQCYECGSFQHLRPLCPKLKKQEVSSAIVNRIHVDTEDELLAPYTTTGHVNGIETTILRDTGSTIDIVCQRYTTHEVFTGEHVWVQQPLDEAPTSLPIAKVELNGDFGRVITKAAVIPNALDQGCYLLGNKTASLIAEAQRKGNLVPHQLIAVSTRAQKREAEQVPDIQDQKPGMENSFDTEVADTSVNVEDKLVLPAVEKEGEVASSLLKVDPETFAAAQMQSKDLLPYFECIDKNPLNNEEKGTYLLKDKLPVKRKFDNSFQRYLLLVPVEYKEQLKTLCHEGTSGHVGVAKTKDRLAKYFFWPSLNCEITKKWTTDSLGSFLSRESRKGFSHDEYGPLSYFVGFARAKKKSLLTDEQELKGVSFKIREAFPISPWKNYEKDITLTPAKQLTFDDLRISDLVPKGCNSVVHSASIKDEILKLEVSSMPIHDFTHRKEKDALGLTRIIISHSEGEQNFKNEEFQHMHSKDLQQVEKLESCDLSVKVMYNYSAGSNAIATWHAMCKETLKAISEFSFNDTVNYKFRKKRLKPHFSIVELYFVFADQVSWLPCTVENFPQALPVCTFIHGCGRNMTLFLMMKIYHCSLKAYLEILYLTIRPALLLFAQLLEELQHLQQNEKVLRDFKANNTFLDLSHGDLSPRLAIPNVGCSLETLQLSYTSYENGKSGNVALMAPDQCRS